MSNWSHYHREREIIRENLKVNFTIISSLLQPDPTGELWLEKAHVDELTKSADMFHSCLLRYAKIGSLAGFRSQSNMILELHSIIKDMKPSEHWIKTVKAYLKLTNLEVAWHSH